MKENKIIREVVEKKSNFSKIKIFDYLLNNESVPQI